MEHELKEGSQIRYVTNNGHIHPAWVSKILDKEKGLINLFVLNDEAGVVDHRKNVNYAELKEHEKAEPNTWHWG